jgi:hypothetical protein
MGSVNLLVMVAGSDLTGVGNTLTSGRWGFLVVVCVVLELGSGKLG